MNGLSPRIYGLTAQQAQASNEIATAVPELPTSVSDLISQMAYADYTLPAQPLQLDDAGAVIDNQRNQEIIAAIEAALTSPSTNYTPHIKGQIFSNATLAVTAARDPTCDTLRSYLPQLINRLSQRGQSVNLDDVVLNNLDLGEDGVDLTGMSARRAVFNNVNMQLFKMADADLTGSRFIDGSLAHADMRNANITDATFSNVFFMNTMVDGLTGNQSAIFQAGTPLSASAVHESVRQREFLHGTFFSVIPDRDKFTFIATRSPGEKSA